jgi:hypothetical protein
MSQDELALPAFLVASMEEPGGRHQDIKPVNILLGTSAWLPPAESYEYPEFAELSLPDDFVEKHGMWIC